MPDLSADLNELEELLFALPHEDEAMLLSELDGLLAGVLVSPEPIAQEEWLPLVWAGEPFPDEARNTRLTELLTARKAEIAGDLLRGGLAYAPVYDIDERHDDILWEFWIEGFKRAMALRHAKWMALLDSEDEDLGAALLGLVMLIGVAERELDPGEHDDLVADAPDLIPYFLETMYRRQHGLPRVVMDPGPASEPVRHGPKVGRNDPCPCGSGKKFKKCCGGR